MKYSTNNPSANILGGGINEDAIASAIKQSGYPLQSVVSSFLRKHFRTWDEWAYADRDSGEMRTLDIHAAKWDFEQKTRRGQTVLNLFIECKQSELPFVFFLSASNPRVLDFPLIARIPHDEVAITDKDGEVFLYPLPYVLGLSKHPFITTPSYCYTFSKCMRKGKDIELSGSESYNGLVLPLLKSLLSFQKDRKLPKLPKGVGGLNRYIGLSIGVLNAPMIAFDAVNNPNELIMVPWVRVIRHDYEYQSDPETEEVRKKSKLYALDIVHKDFFENYIVDFVLPYYEICHQVFQKHSRIIYRGKAFVDASIRSYENDIDFEPILKPILAIIEKE
jgi:hypothetical protein